DTQHDSSKGDTGHDHRDWQTDRDYFYRESGKPFDESNDPRRGEHRMVRWAGCLHPSIVALLVDYACRNESSVVVVKPLHDCRGSVEFAAIAESLQRLQSRDSQKL